MSVFRPQYRELTSAEAMKVDLIKRSAEALYDIIKDVPPSREGSIALTKLEESVMWAVKAITK